MLNRGRQKSAGAPPPGGPAPCCHPDCYVQSGAKPDTGERVKITCTNPACTFLGAGMHAACFDKCEQALVGSMRHSVHLWLTRQVKDMSDDEICSTLWTSNYDRLCRTQCKCQCGAGFFKCVTQKSESSAGVGHKTRAAPTEVVRFHTEVAAAAEAGGGGGAGGGGERAAAVESADDRRRNRALAALQEQEAEEEDARKEARRLKAETKEPGKRGKALTGAKLAADRKAKADALRERLALKQAEKVAASALKHTPPALEVQRLWRG
ncbi:hypothetical protein EMIHUDRAFT_355085, partial [Emiliania huxleyi CCMP1516]